METRVRASGRGLQAWSGGWEGRVGKQFKALNAASSGVAAAAAGMRRTNDFGLRITTAMWL